MVIDLRVLVSGGAGYIGSHVVLKLVEAGHEVTVYDNLSTGNDWAVIGAELVVADLGDRSALAGLCADRRFDAVIHFAAYISVPESVAKPLKYYRNNTSNTLNLLEVCADYNIDKIVFSSTCAVYGIPDEIPVNETMPLAPISPYGTSKMFSERMIMDTAAASPLRYVMLRYFNVAGADMQGRIGQVSGEAGHLIKVAAETVVGLRPQIQVYGTDYPTPDGTCIRDYVHVDDLAAAHVSALDYLDDRVNASTVMNCGYGRGYSVTEVLKSVKRVSGVDLPIVLTGRREGDAPALMADNSLIRRTLDWQPEYDDLDVIVRSALDWEKKLNQMATKGATGR